MRIGRCAIALGAAACIQAGVAGAQTRALTLADVLALARERAPRIVSARLAVDEARSRLAGASLRFRSNPEVDAGVGHRDGLEESFTDFEIGVWRPFEPPSRRSARLASANAAIARTAAGVDDVTREVLWQAAGAYFRAPSCPGADPATRGEPGTCRTRPCGGRPPVHGGRHRRPRREHRQGVSGTRQRGA